MGLLATHARGTGLQWQAGRRSCGCAPALARIATAGQGQNGRSQIGADAPTKFKPRRARRQKPSFCQWPTPTPLRVRKLKASGRDPDREVRFLLSRPTALQVREALRGPQGCSNRELRESRGTKKRRFAPNREVQKKWRFALNREELNKISNRPNPPKR